MISPLYFATGATYARDVAAVQLQDWEYADALAFCGPIDAPELMPAGACNCTDARDWRGRAVPALSMAVRGAVVTLTADQLTRKYVCGVADLADLVNRQVIHGYTPTIRLDPDFPPDELAERGALAAAYNLRAARLGLGPCYH